MAPPQSPPRHYTIEEYQALEEASEQRHEYFEGEVYAMSGASATHHTIRQNCVISLRTALHGRGCKIYDEGMQLAVTLRVADVYDEISITLMGGNRRRNSKIVVSLDREPQ